MNTGSAVEQGASAKDTAWAAAKGVITGTALHLANMFVNPYVKILASGGKLPSIKTPSIR